MKKVKIMLVSALVVAAVGGALAFKAQKFGTQLFCGVQNSCPTPTTLYTTVGADINHKVNGVFCSTQVSTRCTFVTFE
jgi:hypothetical protein